MSPQTVSFGKSIDQLLSDSENAEIRLKKSLGWLSPTSLGIGAVIGGIYGGGNGNSRAEAASVFGAERAAAGIFAYALDFVLVAGGRASDCAVFRFGGDRLRVRFGVLRGTGGDDSDCGERLHLHVRDDGRTDRRGLSAPDLILEYAVSNMAVSVGFLLQANQPPLSRQCAGAGTGFLWEGEAGSSPRLISYSRLSLREFMHL